MFHEILLSIDLNSVIEMNEPNREFLSVLIPPTQLNVQKSAGPEKLWAGLFYKFYHKYNNIRIFIQDVANAGTNSEWNKKSGNTVAKPPVANETNKNKTPLPFIGVPPDAYIAGDYTYYLKNLGGKCSPPAAGHVFAAYPRRSSAEYLIRYNVNFKTIDMQPRGFINRTTRCYINATLQALLMCPPFFNLMKNIKPNVELALKTQRKQKSRIPIIENV